MGTKPKQNVTGVIPQNSWEPKNRIQEINFLRKRTEHTAVFHEFKFTTNQEIKLIASVLVFPFSKSIRTKFIIDRGNK